MWKTDYLGIHEKIYQQKKAAGESGWSSKEGALGMLDFVDDALRRKGATEKGKLLELGCGDGGVTLQFAKKGFDVYGIDIVPMAISWAQERAKQQGLSAQFQAGNVTDLPYPDDLFKIVLDAACSHCIIEDDRGLFFSQAFRVLKPDGLLILHALCGEPKSEIRKIFDPITRYAVRDGVAGRYFGLPEGILEEIRSVGFRILHWEIMTFEAEEMDDMIVVYAVKP